ncbi:hypothetical protein EYF80_033808 [Liparis tanakae]|uniref:Uncharacterized protein n=1 Tax=Liparis tanakae TaxID=230148 RepID=A0A4Z2GT53_9TELE|nr:hypothetical protein EYF80_033808 [Liparis tanakae]
MDPRRRGVTKTPGRKKSYVSPTPEGGALKTTIANTKASVKTGVHRGDNDYSNFTYMCLPSQTDPQCVTFDLVKTSSVRLPPSPVSSSATPSIDTSNREQAVDPAPADDNKDKQPAVVASGTASCDGWVLETHSNEKTPSPSTQSALVVSQQEDAAHRQRRHHQRSGGGRARDFRRWRLLHATFRGLPSCFLLLRGQGRGAEVGQDLQSRSLTGLDRAAHVAAPQGGRLCAGPVDPQSHMQ